MNVKDLPKRLLKLAEKYKFVLLVAVVGLALLLWPTGEKKEAGGDTPAASAETAEALEEKLENVLAQIDGAGRVKVALTMESGSVSVLAQDRQTDSEEDKTETVLVDSDGGSSPVVIQSIGPVYRGALVVCDGGSSPAVELEIVTAVSALTGLGADKITVVKMKS